MWHAERARIGYGFEIEAKGRSRALVRQVHGNEIVSFARPVDFEAPQAEADGIVTTVASHPVYVFTADCLPLLLYSREPEHRVAAIHCGWRGALQGIAAAARVKMQAPPERLHAILGPSLGPCCFEVKDDFVRAFDAQARDIHPYLERRAGKRYCDLARFVVATDLPGVLVDSSHWKCTFCSEPKLPSYRRNKDTDPRLRSWIAFS